MKNHSLIGTAVFASILALAASMRAAEPPRPPMEDGPQRILAQLRGRIQDLQRARQEMMERTHGASAMPEAVPAMLQRTEQQRQEIELELAAKTVRRQAIQDAIAQTSAQARDRLKDDPVLQELERILVARMEQLKAAEEALKAGAGPRHEVNQAMMAVSEAKVQLIMRREAITRGAAGDLLNRLNDELTMLSINNLELEARAKLLQERTEALLKQLPLAAEAERIEGELRALRQMHEQIQMQLHMAPMGMRPHGGEPPMPPGPPPHMPPPPPPPETPVPQR